MYTPSQIPQEVDRLSKELRACQGVLTALGDETRQYIVFQMMRADSNLGLRVPQITEMTSLSRPAVSHHLQILKDAGIVGVRHEGTRNYYYFDAGESLDGLVGALNYARAIMASLPPCYATGRVDAGTTDPAGAASAAGAAR